jgi:hypothetical protein
MCSGERLRNGWTSRTDSFEATDFINSIFCLRVTICISASYIKSGEKAKVNSRKAILHGVAEAAATCKVWTRRKLTISF